MNYATVTTKGRITLPATVRQALNLTQGNRVAFVEVAPGRFEIRPVAGSVLALKGMFGPAGKVASIVDMNDAIALNVVKKQPPEPA